MSPFSDKLKKAIDESGISINRLAQQSGLSASMLYKIQSGSRLPDSPETLDRILDAMLCGLPQRTDLVQTYKIERIGVGYFACFQALKQMLEDMSMPAELHKVMPPAEHRRIPDVVEGLENVNVVVRTILEQEVRLEHGELRLLVPPYYGYCFETLSQALINCAPGFRGANHLFCLRASATEDTLLANMETIRRILPKMLIMEHYNPWYCYLPEPDDGTVAFPYFISASSGVLLLAGDLQSAVYLLDPEMLRLFNRRFAEIQQSFRPVLQSGATGVLDYIRLHHRIVASSSENMVPITMSAEPCIMSCVSMEAAARYLPEAVLADESVQSTVAEYFENSLRGGYVCFFTVQGLRHLIEHGELTEIQGPEIPRIRQEDVLDALEEFSRRAKTGKIVPYIFRQEIFQASSKFCMGLYDAKLLSICELPKRKTVFLDITEATVSHVLREYAENALLLGDVFSAEESIRILDDVIREYRAPF